MSTTLVSPYLSVWTVISLRPAAQQAAVKRAIAARGATPLSLPALRLAPMPDASAARQALRAALTCPQLLFTSPAAVRFAAALEPLRNAPTQRVYALGRGTARALARHGIGATHPGDGAMHSEGLLALPDFAPRELKQQGGRDVGVVTAPGGRGLVVHALRARGARLRVAEVYRRLPPRLDRRHACALRESRAPRALLLTSAEALDHALAALPADAAQLLREALVVASSARLAAHARARGCGRTIEAAAPGAAVLLDALDAHVRADAVAQARGAA